MYTIILTEKRYKKNPNTKTTYILESEEVKEITERQHQLTCCDDTLKWFRRLGGSETAERNYTSAGYLVTKLTSKSPDRQIKVVREFDFKYIKPEIKEIAFENLSLLGKYNSLKERNLLTDEVTKLFKEYKYKDSVTFELLNDKLNALNK